MNKEAIQAIIPLLPLQQGFLWNSLKGGDASGVLQLCCTLQGSINIEIFRRAWIATLKQHQALRSSIHWHNVKSPIQLIEKETVFSLTELDFRGVQNQDHALSSYRETDLELGLNISNSPAFRLALLQLDDNEAELIWTISHVILDGWSCSLVINDVLRHYTSLVHKNQEAVYIEYSLKDHTRWLAQQDKSKSIKFWAELLPEEAPTRTILHQDFQPTSTYTCEPSLESIQVSLNSAEHLKLKSALNDAGLGFSSALQGAWASQLYDASNPNKVIFGITVSGREINLEHAADRVGMLINLMPILVEINQNKSVKEWLYQIQDQFFESLAHAYIGLHDIQSVTEYTGNIFETLVVFENQPSVDQSGLLTIKDFKSGIVSSFDITLVIIPRDELVLDIQYRTDRHNSETIESLALRIRNLLCALPDLLSENLGVLTTSYSPETCSAIESTQPKIAKTPETPHKNQVITQLENQLVQIWQDIFNRADISIYDDYFDLGGTSMQAVLIFEKIESLLGTRLPTTSLFNAPSIVNLAALIEQSEPNSFWSDTVEIQGSGDNPPLFVPVVSNDMLMYKNLSSCLGRNQPIYAFRASDPTLSTDALAERLILHIRSIQSHGPYHLAGLSGAGMLAWVMAQKLQRQNQKVALLALLDTYGPEYPKLEPPMTRLSSIVKYFLSGLITAIKKKFSKTPKLITTIDAQISGIQVESNMHLLMDYQSRMAEEYQASLPFVLNINKGKPLHEKIINLICLGLTRFRYGAFSMRGSFIVFIQGLWLENKSEKSLTHHDNPTTSIDIIRNRHDKMYDDLRPYDGHIAYFKVTTRPPGVIDDPQVGWSGLIGKDLTIYDIPGTHNELLRYPNVSILAEHLQYEIGKSNLTIKKKKTSTRLEQESR